MAEPSARSALKHEARNEREERFAEELTVQTKSPLLGLVNER